MDAPGTREIWPELSLDRADVQFYETVINDPVRGSQVVKLCATAAGASVGTGTVTLSSGADGLAGLRPGHFTGDLSTDDGPCGLAALDNVEEVGIVVIPDAVGRQAPAGARAPPPPFSSDQTTELYNVLLVSCASHRRFALLDEPSAQDLPADALAWAQSLQQGSTAAAFGSLTYPWLLGTDPLQEAGAVLAMPGSGHVAGIVARTDLAVGVHKAPANATRGRLNAASVNVITMRPGRGIRQMGARTLDQGTAWRYVNVRRLISMIELSLESSRGFSQCPASCSCRGAAC